MRRPFFVGVIVCLSLGSYLGCSVKRDYKLLSFFFDGVPDPNAPKIDPGNPSRTLPGDAKPILVVHKPYTEGKCTACHETKTTMAITLARNACEVCHVKVMTEHHVMHGAVTSGACLWCHAPHESPYKNLLKAEAPTICVQCHEQDTLPYRPADHQNPKSNCLTCHYGHGAPEPKMLKPAGPTTAKVACLELGGRP